MRSLLLSFACLAPAYVAAAWVLCRHRRGRREERRLLRDAFNKDGVRLRRVAIHFPPEGSEDAHKTIMRGARFTGPGSGGPSDG